MTEAELIAEARRLARPCLWLRPHAAEGDRYAAVWHGIDAGFAAIEAERERAREELAVTWARLAQVPPERRMEPTPTEPRPVCDTFRVVTVDCRQLPQGARDGCLTLFSDGDEGTATFTPGATLPPPDEVDGTPLYARAGLSFPPIETLVGPDGYGDALWRAYQDFRTPQNPLFLADAFEDTYLMLGGRHERGTGRNCATPGASCSH